MYSQHLYFHEIYCLCHGVGSIILFVEFYFHSAVLMALSKNILKYENIFYRLFESSRSTD